MLPHLAKRGVHDDARKLCLPLHLVSVFQKTAVNRWADLTHHRRKLVVPFDHRQFARTVPRRQKRPRKLAGPGARFKGEIVALGAEIFDHPPRYIVGGDVTFGGTVNRDDFGGLDLFERGDFPALAHGDRQGLVRAGVDRGAVHRIASM